jgi:hypothetical protein
MNNQLRATLSERHVNMMCFSQSLGIGLFLQNGRAIYYAGPGLATIAYFLAGIGLKEAFKISPHSNFNRYYYMVKCCLSWRDDRLIPR